MKKEYNQIYLTTEEICHSLVVKLERITFDQGLAKVEISFLSYLDSKAVYQRILDSYLKRQIFKVSLELFGKRITIDQTIISSYCETGYADSLPKIFLTFREQ